MMKFLKLCNRFLFELNYNIDSEAIEYDVIARHEFMYIYIAFVHIQHTHMICIVTGYKMHTHHKSVGFILYLYKTSLVRCVKIGFWQSNSTANIQSHRVYLRLLCIFGII